VIEKHEAEEIPSVTAVTLQRVKKNPRDCRAV
jgi:hypothetical protein